MSALRKRVTFLTKGQPKPPENVVPLFKPVVVKKPETKPRYVTQNKNVWDLVVRPDGGWSYEKVNVK